jgi:hypothetical protein
MKPKVPCNGYVLFDSERKSKADPDAWDHPPQEVLDRIQPGYLVNVGVTHVKLAGERFWGIVREINGSAITIQIDQKLVCCKEHGLNYMDDVSIEMRHVFGIVNAKGETVWPVDEELAT